MSKESVSRREALRAAQEAQAKQSRNRKIVGIGAAAVAVILAVVMIVVGVNAAGSRQSGTWYPKNVTAAKDGVLMYAASTPKADAPTIEVYLDFQCPICKVAEEQYGATMKQMATAGDIKLIQHTLTFMDNNLRNTASKRAANAASCSDTSGKYAEMTAAIFANQAAEETVGSEGYSDALLRNELPAKVGITGQDLTAYQQCYDQKLGDAFHADLLKASYDKGITGTPTFTRNGTKIPVNVGVLTPDQFKSLLLTGQ